MKWPEITYWVFSSCHDNPLLVENIKVNQTFLQIDTFNNMWQTTLGQCLKWYPENKEIEYKIHSSKFYATEITVSKQSLAFYTNNPNVDPLSRVIHNFHGFEHSYVDQIIQVLLENPDMDYIDIGANFGNNFAILIFYILICCAKCCFVCFVRTSASIQMN